MQTPLRRKQYGMSKLITELTEYLSNHTEYYRTEIYSSNGEKAAIKTGIRKLIRKNLLGEPLLRAIAADILGPGNPDKLMRLDSATYKYLRQYLYNGNGRALLADLQDILKET